MAWNSPPTTRTAAFPLTRTSPWSVAQGEDWNSAQFLFDPADLAYAQNHWISLDHDQRVTGSFGAAYTWKEGEKNSTRVYVDALYGTGLRTDATASLTARTFPTAGRFRLITPSISARNKASSCKRNKC